MPCNYTRLLDLLVVSRENFQNLTCEPESITKFVSPFPKYISSPLSPGKDLGSELSHFGEVSSRTQIDRGSATPADTLALTVTT